MTSTVSLTNRASAAGAKSAGAPCARSFYATRQAHKRNSSLLGRARQLQALVSPRGGAAVVTSASGVIMLWSGAGSRLANWWGSAGERAIVIGSVAGLAALAWGLAVNAPTAALGGYVSATMLSASVIAMAAAHHL